MSVNVLLSCCVLKVYERISRTVTKQGYHYQRNVPNVGIDGLFLISPDSLRLNMALIGRAKMFKTNGTSTCT